MTPKVLCSMGVSLDGFISGPDGEIDWSVPDDELFRFHLERVAALDASLLGRRLYETMLYWEDAEQNRSLSQEELEFARVWQGLQKVVFSTTLERVEGSNYTLASGDPASELQRLEREGAGDIEVGGALLASQLMELDLIDEYNLFVHPVVLGEGRPYFPPLADRLNLELVETRTFASRVVYLGYRRPEDLRDSPR